uniref:alanine and arginine-rich domain-containing protein n=1 Tax=Odobenus rosmarus divergens TaxID=9708 RepID=UPI00063CB94D|nr:PREDICTED: alanine and arginine-rich domain-containing protein [Odobenus rosmarus divergens]
MPGVGPGVSEMGPENSDRRREATGPGPYGVPVSVGLWTPAPGTAHGSPGGSKSVDRQEEAHAPSQLMEDLRRRLAHCAARELQAPWGGGGAGHRGRGAAGAVEPGARRERRAGLRAGLWGTLSPSSSAGAPEPRGPFEDFRGRGELFPGRNCVENVYMHKEQLTSWWWVLVWRQCQERKLEEQGRTVEHLCHSGGLKLPGGLGQGLSVLVLEMRFQNHQLARTLLDLNMKMQQLKKEHELEIASESQSSEDNVVNLE